MGAMLRVDLQRLTRGPASIDSRVPVDDPLWQEADVTLAAPLTVEGSAQAAGRGGVLVRGSLRAQIATACRRCLAPLNVDMTDTFEMLFDPAVDEGDEDFVLYPLDPEADELDLSVPLLERVLLKMPEFPLCREDCRGLCPQCGTDLNTGDCDCTSVESDPRWAPLLALRGGH